VKIDPNKTWKLVERRYDVEEDPVRKRNLGLVLAHMKAEGRADIEGVVATLCEKPKYVVYADLDNADMNPSGSKDAVRKFYDLTIVQTGAHQLEFDCDRVTVDEGSVFTEGTMRQLYPGRTLLAMGIEIDDPDAYYATEYRMAVVWPVDPLEERLTGEEVYSSGDAFAGIAGRKVARSDILPIASAA
jgi:hypothetical protein